MLRTVVPPSLANLSHDYSLGSTTNYRSCTIDHALTSADRSYQGCTWDWNSFGPMTDGAGERRACVAFIKACQTALILNFAQEIIFPISMWIHGFFAVHKCNTIYLAVHILRINAAIRFRDENAPSAMTVWAGKVGAPMPTIALATCHNWDAFVSTDTIHVISIWANDQWRLSISDFVFSARLHCTTIRVAAIILRESIKVAFGDENLPTAMAFRARKIGASVYTITLAACPHRHKRNISTFAFVIRSAGSHIHTIKSVCRSCHCILDLRLALELQQKMLQYAINLTLKVSTVLALINTFGMVMDFAG